MDAEEELYNKLKASHLKDPLNPVSEYVPRDVIEASITEEIVKATLKQAPGDCNLPSCVCSRGKIDGAGSLKKVFAILVKIEKVEILRRLMKEGLTDRDLPLEQDNKKGLRSVADPKRKFTSFTLRAGDSFVTSQWAMLAPVFNVTGEHMNLDPRHPLPFLKPHGDENDVRTNGQSSVVYRFNVHEAHQKGFEEQAGSLEVALKEFRYQSRSVFEQERSTLNRIRALPTKHIIRSFGTFSQGDKHYIILPWAEGGDLDDFWETEKSKPRTPELALWCLQQILGLAEALQALHCLDDQGNDNCRHGDLKPGNILCYRIRGEDTLKIADFGISRIHSKATFQRRTATKTGATTPSYQAPEAVLAALKDVARSRKYDIWSFGCIFLEFTVWLVCGWDELQRFTADRRANSDKADDEAHFYELVTGDTAQIHPAVRKKLEELRIGAQSGEGTALGDLLGLLENKVLQVKVEDRLEAATLCGELRGIVDRAEVDPVYLRCEA